ncbi:MAG: hypothetical protein MK105_16365 [Crocinitomicaceae bacterium]|nr:hypothetical protein [Crocinitomicaceae bacterium]
MRQIITLILLNIFLSTCGQSQSTQQKNSSFFDEIKLLTTYELPVYIVLNVPNKPDKILISNMELYWLEYDNLNFEKEYPDTLVSLLKNRIWNSIRTDWSQIEEYSVNLDELNNLKGKTAKEVYTQFFDDIGRPKENYSENQIEAAVVYLFEKNVLVHQGKATLYNIYNPPK